MTDYFIKLLLDEAGRGYGFVPLVGSGLSAPSGIPVGAGFGNYLFYYLNEIIGDYPKSKRVELINTVWEANNLKGFITEMEATAMLKLAKDWGVENELIALVLR